MNIYVDSMATLMFAIWHKSRQQETSVDGGTTQSKDVLINVNIYDIGTLLTKGAIGADTGVISIFNDKEIIQVVQY